jgi:hypothetical protein
MAQGSGLSAKSGVSFLYRVERGWGEFVGKEILC